MSNQAIAPAPGQPPGGAVLPPDALAVIRAVAQAFSSQPPRATLPIPQGSDDDLPPLLAPGQVAVLLGVSRNTVDRMIADGELPSVVLRRGARQQMVRVPKAFVVQLLDDLGGGARISLRDYAAQWTTQAALPRHGTDGDPRIAEGAA